MQYKIKFDSVEPSVVWEKVMGPYLDQLPMVVDGCVEVILFDKRGTRGDKSEVVIDSDEFIIDTGGAPTKPMYTLPEDEIRARLATVYPGLDKLTCDVGGHTFPAGEWTLRFCIYDGVCSSFGLTMKYTEKA